MCVTHGAVSVSLVGGDRCPEPSREQRTVGTLILVCKMFYLLVF